MLNCIGFKVPANVYRLLVSETLAEYRYFKAQILDICQVKTSGNESLACPICPKVIISSILCFLLLLRAVVDMKLF
jgi:hypothetical protein